MKPKEIYWTSSCFITLVTFSYAHAQLENCTDTPYDIAIGVEVNCPDGMQEVLEEGTTEFHWKSCCVPNTDGEKMTRRYGLGCQASTCSSEEEDFCSTRIYWRKYKGEMFSYEEISRDICSTDEGELGVTALCCRKNSTDGVLATTYGAEFNEFPFMAFVDTVTANCGGTIYNKRWIITAAHCMDDKEKGELRELGVGGNWTIKVGRNVASFEIPENNYVVVQTVPHPEYDFDYILNDIALFKLDRDIQFGPRVKALQIAPRGFDELKYSDKAVIVGWGTTDTLQVSDNLQKANFMLRTDKRCFANDSETETPWHEWVDSELEDRYLCVGGILDGKFNPVAGAGDSGGPAVCRGEDGYGILCGVTSFGEDDENCTKYLDEENCKPSVYVEVDFYHDWIVSVAGEQDPSSFHKKQLYGEVVKNDKYEHQVHVTSAEGKPCGGTLIAPDALVTAAQCVAPGDGSNKTYTDIKVTTRENGAKPIGIWRLSILDGFKRMGEAVNVTAQGFRIVRTDNIYRNDLAVLRLKQNVTIHPTKLATLPSKGEFPVNPVIELAFPRNSNLSQGSELRQREFNISSRADCQRRINRLSKIGINIQVAKNILCGVETFSGGSTCDRELGGGLICKGQDGRDVLCGVQVYRICEWAVPNGFVDVAQHSDWVAGRANIATETLKLNKSLSLLRFIADFLSPII